ncbi:NAD-dependent epimerase/dehydratase family protein [Leptospira sp. GIMC2001]|uniref:NAD-dependent epimerase/dehydratase family protein n=1 Tax=Leptospira sp. GIMC2001 TaxID=1513297 RepID=UPI00234A7E0B|nr:NAD-dependent epimerase/dehydratase family protein [Leptospira sp. GIMC2001]WCL51182.1 NAD-dependent epimerase/dehydratase family protein [Leptospira sp. GIMC2001]
MNSKKILISGTNGFLGSFLMKSKFSEIHELIPVSRNSENRIVTSVIEKSQSELPINKPVKFPSMNNADVAIHLAGLAHETKNASDRNSYFQANVELTESFLHSASELGVKHFLFFSTIKVYGEGFSNDAIKEDSKPSPSDIYSETKLLAEELIQKKANSLGMSYTIIRPPLVYGPNPKANILSIMNWIQKGYPIPISSRLNRRSFVSTYNIESMLLQILESKASKNQIFLVQDPSPFSTLDLIEFIAEAFGKNSRTLKIPHNLGKIIFSALGKGRAWDKLNGDLYMDDRSSRDKLSWSPPHSTREGIYSMVQGLFKI